MCVYYATKVPPIEDPIGCYRRFFQAQDSAFYSTHDYIAHYALDYLCNSDPSGKYNWLRDQNQRYFYIFMLGNEYPDYSNARTRPTLSLARIGIVNSYVRYSHSNEGALTSARIMSLRAVKYLNKPYSWREEPAFFLGTLTHYIGDLSFPPHIYRPYNPEFSKWMNNQVSRKTILDDYYHNGGDRFFRIDLEEIIGYTPDKLNILELFTFLPDDNYADIIYFIAEMMKFTTILNLEVLFNLQVGDGSWNVTSIHKVFLEKGDFDFDNVGRFDTDYVEFFNRIEQLLNWAVYWTAAALKICLDQWDGEEQREDDQPIPQPVQPEREPPFDNLDFLARYGAMVAALTAAGLIGRKFLSRFG
ncbi:MAG: zinc dependent phospholipase C family protein [Candidatus Hodarchaeales archaeon]|jgi:hypothetical protein